MRDARDRHERAVRCDGRRWRARRTRLTRTAKSCGPDAAVLALSPREAKLLGGDGGKKAVHRGELEVSRKAIAQGRPECFRRTCMLVCASSVRNCTRDRGCGAHPVFPASSDKEGGKFFSKPRTDDVARSRTHTQLSSPGLTGRPSIPETPVIEPIGRSVLDPPHARRMTAEDDAGPSKQKRRELPAVLR